MTQGFAVAKQQFEAKRAAKGGREPSTGAFLRTVNKLLLEDDDELGKRNWPTS